MRFRTSRTPRGLSRVLFGAMTLLPPVVLGACDDGTPDPNLTGDEAFLDTIQARTFGYFWELANPVNGLVPDRAPTPRFASVAAAGFGLSAYAVGVERGYIGWLSEYRWGEFYGQEHVGFAPLFGHQYSHVWIDFRGIQDA